MPSRDRYESPLSSRNASVAMQAVWSPQRKFSTWRRLWLALAEAERELGLPISAAQVKQIKEHLDDIDFDRAAEHEKRLRHDVMAHVHTLGEAAPLAKPIIHLGATSQFVVCNTELLQMRDALNLVAGKLANAIDLLGSFASKHRALPTLAFTHYQPAQPTTVGKRAALWAHDLALALAEIEHRIDSLRFRGCKGTTGTQASFLELFTEAIEKEGAKGARGRGAKEKPQQHDTVIREAHRRCDELDKLVTQKMGWDPDKRFVVTGQTYPRVVDGMVVSSLAAVASVCFKIAADIRLLANRKEMEEPFEAEQIGSSAMAYKRNPMRCERICGLSRFVIGLTQVPFTTAAEQWFERTLDDSSTRRLTLPEPFLALDGALDILINVAGGMVVYEKTIAANLAAELPFMATENLLMAAVSRGADRQEMHEVIRRHSQAAAQRVKMEGAANDLLDRLRADPAFAGVDIGAALDPSRFVGRAPEQVDAFVREVVVPIRKRYREVLGQRPELRV